jgi:hypothetical protein
MRTQNEKDQDHREFMRGCESTGPAPTPELERIVQLLRQPPVKPIKTSQMFNKLLGIKLHRNQYGHGKYAVTSWLKSNLSDSRCIDHYMDIILSTGDVLLLVQPYHHPDRQDVAKVESQGGYLVCPDEGWGFMHHCAPNVYLIPQSNLSKFERNVP